MGGRAWTHVHLLLRKGGGWVYVLVVQNFSYTHPPHEIVNFVCTHTVLPWQNALEYFNKCGGMVQVASSDVIYYTRQLTANSLVSILNHIMENECVKYVRFGIACDLPATIYILFTYYIYSMRMQFYKIRKLELTGNFICLVYFTIIIITRFTWWFWAPSCCRPVKTANSTRNR